MVDFEDRLKLIITNVLNEDKDSLPPQKPPPPFSSSSSAYFCSGKALDSKRLDHVSREIKRESPKGVVGAPQQPDYTLVSPAKLALRRHLSQEKIAQEASGHSFGAAPYKTSASSSACGYSANAAYSRNVGDLISGEIERTLELTAHEASSAAPHGGPSAVDMTVKTPSPRPRPSSRSAARAGCLGDDPSKHLDRPPVSSPLRVVYSPISRPNSTESLPSTPHTPQGIVDGNPKTKSPCGAPAFEEKPYGSGGGALAVRDGLEGRLASLYHGAKCPLPVSTPPSSHATPTPPPVASTPGASIDTSKLKVTHAASHQENSKTSLAPPSGEGLVEGLAATLHARFLRPNHVMQVCGQGGTWNLSFSLTTFLQDFISL